MFRKIVCSVLVAFMLILFAVPGYSGDIGLQYGFKSSTMYGFPTFVGLKMLQGDNSFTARTGMYFVDIDTPGVDDNLIWWTLGGTFDHYLSGEKLRPYIGGDVDLHFWDFDDTETSASLTPHFGTEYWLSEKFSVSGEAGITFGIGEVYQNENRVGTTSSIHVNYYFMSSSD